MDKLLYFKNVRADGAIRTGIERNDERMFHSFIDGRKPRDLAQKLIGLYDSNAIVTPVASEFLAGASKGLQLRQYREFLAHFDCVDRQNILKEDWREASNLAQRIPPLGNLAS
jgi:hypothetical protein